MAEIGSMITFYLFTTHDWQLILEIFMPIVGDFSDMNCILAKFIMSK